MRLRVRVRRIAPASKPPRNRLCGPCRPLVLPVYPQLEPILLTPQVTAVDWLQDFAEAPIISKTWHKYAPGLRVHAGHSVTLRQRQAGLAQALATWPFGGSHRPYQPILALSGGLPGAWLVPQLRPAITA